MGPYLRLHAPALIRKHDLMNENICSDVFLYTDCDVLFVNVSIRDLLAELVQLGGGTAPAGAVWSYSVEHNRKYQTPQNTGIMFINNTAFGAIYDDFVAFGVAHKFGFGSYDQGWINAYSAANPGTSTFLHVRWNWKVYWGGDPREVKIVHFHGPKPGRGTTLACLASQNRTCQSALIGRHEPGTYISLVPMGFNSDGGWMANFSLSMYQAKIDSISAPWKRRMDLERRKNSAKRAYEAQMATFGREAAKLGITPRLTRLLPPGFDAACYIRHRHNTDLYRGLGMTSPKDALSVTDKQKAEDHWHSTGKHEAPLPGSGGRSRGQGSGRNFDCAAK